MNPRQEIFAQELAKGLSKTEAYSRAGYKGDRTAASRLSTNVNIRLRVNQLQADAAKSVTVTIEGLTRELDIARNIAIKNKNGSAAVSAIMAKAKLNGLLGSSQVTVPEPEIKPVPSNRDIARRIAYILYLAERERIDTPAP